MYIHCKKKYTYVPMIEILTMFEQYNSLNRLFHFIEDKRYYKMTLHYIPTINSIEHS